MLHIFLLDVHALCTIMREMFLFLFFISSIVVHQFGKQKTFVALS